MGSLKSTIDFQPVFRPRHFAQCEAHRTMLDVLPRSELEPIPVLDTGPDFPMETLVAYEARAHALLDLATVAVPSAALRQLDKVSRRWLEKWENAHLAEIDGIAKRLARPGAY